MNQLTRLPTAFEPAAAPPRRRRHARNGVFGVLDIGSTKVVCLIARIESDGSPRVLGFGWQRGRGWLGRCDLWRFTCCWCGCCGRRHHLVG